eukprot:9284669-Pyramimonas_sp.AAC.1
MFRQIPGGVSPLPHTYSTRNSYCRKSRNSYSGPEEFPVHWGKGVTLQLLYCCVVDPRGGFPGGGAGRWGVGA